MKIDKVEVGQLEQGKYGPIKSVKITSGDKIVTNTWCIPSVADFLSTCQGEDLNIEIIQNGQYTNFKLKVTEALNIATQLRGKTIETKVQHEHLTDNSNSLHSNQDDLPF